VHQAGMEESGGDEAPPLAFRNAMDLTVTQDRTIEKEEILLKVRIDL
jgi:hypothetical protein